MQPGSVRPASLPYRLERQAKSRPVLWRATAARREVARCGQRRRDRSFSYRTDQLDSAELVIKMERRHLDGDVGNGGWVKREAPAEGGGIGRAFRAGVGGAGLRGVGAPGRVLGGGRQARGRVGR